MSLRTFIILTGIIITGAWLLVYFWRVYQQKKSSQELNETEKPDAPYSLSKQIKQLKNKITNSAQGDQTKAHQPGITRNRSGKTLTGPIHSIHSTHATHTAKPVKTIATEKHDKNIKSEELVLIHLQAKQATGFDGKLLLDIFTKRGLDFGDMDIFHRHVLYNGEKRLVYSIANGREPGHLQPEHLKEENIHCLVLFLNLAKSYNPAKAYNEMIDIAQFISQKLDSELYDAQMSVLTRQTIEHQKEQIMENQRRTYTGFPPSRE